MLRDRFRCAASLGDRFRVAASLGDRFRCAASLGDRFRVAICGFVLGVMLPAGIAAAEPLPKFVRLEVQPPRVELRSRRARVQLVLTGHTSEGNAVDVTRLAEWTSSAPNTVAVESTRAVPHSDGEATLTARVGGLEIAVPAVVSGQAAPDPVRFRGEVLAALTKNQCNAGSCHGAPEGKGGFMLSMQAYKPSIDEIALRQGGFARRLEPADPAESLLLKKPLLRVAHVGGKKLQTTDTAYRVLLDWIGEGGNLDPAGTPQPKKLRLSPGPARRLNFPFREQQLRAEAEFDDGSIRDITPLASYVSSDEGVAGVDADGLVTARRRGLAAISVRYLELVESTYFTVVEPIEGFAAAWTDPPEANRIDALVHAKLKELQYLPGDLCDDATFQRRLRLDLTGLLPTAAQARAYLADSSPDKHLKLIDELLASEEFARHWAGKTADLLRVSPTVLQEDRAKLFNAWLVDAWRENRPFDRFVRELLTSAGSTRAVGPANYFQAVTKSEDLAETTAQLFMGSRINCAKCHNHPFENWTQDDYYRLAAAFVRVRQDEDDIAVAPLGEMRHPATGQVMLPWGASSTTQGKDLPTDRREVFVDWLAKAGNPFFARVEANRIWAHLLGRGIVHPVDDFRSSNPPTNPELLDWLAAEFERSGFDRKALIRLICASRTYRRSGATNRFNADDAVLFSHAIPRRLTAEQLRDAIGYVSRTLTPVEQAQAELGRDRVARESRRSELAAEQAAWEAAQRKALRDLPLRPDVWFVAGPFPGNKIGDLHQARFAPELGFDPRADLSPLPLDESGKPQPAGKEKPLSWTPRPDLFDGEEWDVTARQGATYFARELHVAAEGTAQLELQSDGPFRIWVDGKELRNVEKNRRFGDKAESIALPLAAGTRRLLLKLGHNAKKVRLKWNWTRFEGDALANLPCPADAAAWLATRDEPLPEALRIRSQERRFAADRKMRDLEKAIVNRELRMDYLTQRPYPETSRFTEAFGQPRRTSACACERSSEPTIDQSLELLNGTRLDGACGGGSGLYIQFRTDPQLIEELCLSAYARLPTDLEKQVMGDLLKTAPDRRQAVRDLIWAIVNTQEFLFRR